MKGMTNRERTQRIALSGLLVALMLVLGYVESLIPVAAGIPGIKLGLSNGVLIFAIYMLGIPTAFVLMLLKVVLSGLDAEAAGAGTGTYGLFRDLSAPFGVAVLVPLFTNTVASGIASGTAPAAAAVSSIRFLSLVEIACVAAGIAVVCLLPVLRKK